MVAPATTIKVFGAYVMAAGTGLVLAPGLLLAAAGLPDGGAAAWVRVLGAVSGALGYYYWYCGVHEARPFFEASVRGRAFVFVAFAVLAALGLVPPLLGLFGVVDLAGAIWTALALRRARPELT